MAGLGFKRDKHGFSVGIGQTSFSQRDFKSFSLEHFQGLLLWREVGCFALPIPWPLSGVPSSSSNLSSWYFPVLLAPPLWWLVLNWQLVAALWACRHSSVLALALFSLALGRSCLGFSDHSWVEGSPLRTEHARLCTPHSLSLCLLTTSTQRWLKSCA